MQIRWSMAINDMRPITLRQSGLRAYYKFSQGNKKGLAKNRKPLNLLVAMGGIEPPTLGL